VATSTAAQLVQGTTVNSDLNAATTNGVPGTGDGDVEDASQNRLKKQKTHVEKSAQFILPDGSRRCYKPHHIDENSVPSTVGRKERAGKKVK
jgi:hypothetical protein